jgi:ABC-type lipoprotein release transport system permease subunit
MNVLAIGMRSIGRNRRRTLVTTAAMGLAGCIMIFYSALMEGLFTTMERNALTMELGDVQIHAEGWRRDPSLYTTIPDPERIERELAEMGYRSTPRLYAFGLAALGSSSAGVQIRGYSVAREREVTSIHLHVERGEWLSDADPKGVVIGKKLAKTLDATIGSELVLVSQAADGSMANDLYLVRGILKQVGDQVDRGGLFMVDRAFRELMVVLEGAHEIVVLRPDRELSIDAAEAGVAKVAPDQEVLSWRKLQPALARMLDLSSLNSIFLLIITYAAIAMVVLNATLMSVFERIREFGVMKALGVSPAQVAGVVFVEVMTQAALASAVALAIGVPLSLYFQAHGIDLSSIADDISVTGIAIDPIWYCELDAHVILGPIASLFVMVGLAALYPGLKAALIRPLEAIQHR